MTPMTTDLSPLRDAEVMRAFSRRSSARSVNQITRRVFFSTGVLSLLSWTRLGRTLGRERVTDLLAQPVYVPQDFLGMHFHRWPFGKPVSPAPTYRYGTVRSHDFSGLNKGIKWGDIHVAAGQYDWSVLDRWVDAHVQQGKALLYTVYGTPAWLTTAPERRDPYWHPGGSAPPRSLQPLAEFITALVARYNTPSQRRISMIEIWNEPNFVDNTKPEEFWLGSSTELAAMGRVVYRSAKGADRGIRVLSPGFTGNLIGSYRSGDPDLRHAQDSVVVQYMKASDGAGGIGVHWCDAVAFHAYNANLTGAPEGIGHRIRMLREILEHLKAPAPLYCTEAGFMPNTTFARGSETDRVVQLRRLAAQVAALGVSGLYLYAHDDEFVGNPSQHPGIAAAIDSIYASLAGRQLLQASLHGDGAVRVQTDKEILLW